MQETWFLFYFLRTLKQINIKRKDKPLCYMIAHETSLTKDETLLTFQLKLFSRASFPPFRWVLRTIYYFGECQSLVVSMLCIFQIYLGRLCFPIILVAQISRSLLLHFKIAPRNNAYRFPVFVWSLDKTLLQT